MGTPRWWEPEGTRAYLPVGGVCTYAHFLSRTRSAELGASTPSGEGGSLTAGAGRRSSNGTRPLLTCLHDLGGSMRT